MKHTLKVTALILVMFFITQLIGIAVINAYSPSIEQVVDEETGEIKNVTVYNLPYGTEPPQNVEPKLTLISFIFALIFAVIILLLLMKYKSELILRLWFFFVVSLALGITLNAAIFKIPSLYYYSSIIALVLAIPLAFLKIFKRHILIHNLTELLIYPGIAAIFVPLLNVWTVVLLLILISLYDMYAVWHAGFMQKMAKYQISTLKVFSGFFVPYLGKKQRDKLKKVKSKKALAKKIKVNVAILGGGDIVFPIILSGVVLRQIGLLGAIIISIGATLSLAGLFYISKKGKFYPAMPFISTGCLIALGIAYII